MKGSRWGGSWEKALAWSTFVAMFLALYFALVYAPTEKTMGNVQRIFYFHVAAAWVGMLAFLVVFIASIIYLITRQNRWDTAAHASAEIGVVFTTIVLITGPIWAKPIWHTWWTWDPRLTTTLIMWFLYIAYGKIRAAIGEEEKKARLAAVFAILAFTDVPVDFFAIRWWRTMHPEAIITSQGIALAPDMLPAFYTGLIAFTLLYCYFMILSMRVETMRSEVSRLKESLLP